MLLQTGIWKLSLRITTYVRMYVGIRANLMRNQILINHLLKCKFDWNNNIDLWFKRWTLTVKSAITRRNNGTHTYIRIFTQTYVSASHIEKWLILQSSYTERREKERIWSLNGEAPLFSVSRDKRSADFVARIWITKRELARFYSDSRIINAPANYSITLAANGLHEALPNR